MRDRVLILSGHTLLTEGVISRLEEHCDLFDFLVIDSQWPDVVEQIIEAQPDAVILDASNPEVPLKALSMELLSRIPALQIIYLDSKSAQIGVIRWGSRTVSGVEELLEVLKSCKELQADLPPVVDEAFFERKRVSESVLRGTGSQENV